MGSRTPKPGQWVGTDPAVDLKAPMPGMLSSVCLIDCESMKTGVVARQELPLDWSFSSDGNKQYRQRVGTKKRLKVLLRHHAFGPAQKNNIPDIIKLTDPPSQTSISLNDFESKEYRAS